MNQFRLLRLLFKPSLSSGTFVLALTAVIIGGNAWAYVNTKQLFYEYIFGAYGLKTYLWQQSAGISAAKGILLASPAAYYILVGLIAVAVGISIYASLQGLSLAFSWRVWSGLNTLGPNRQAIAKEIRRRLAIRVTTLLAWSLFGACFFSAILPAVAILNQAGVSHIENSEFIGWLFCLLAACVTAATLHLQVIFLRLVFLRPRVFGGEDLVDEADTHHDWLHTH